MIQGSIVALVTPMDETGAVDKESLRRLIEFHIAEGTDAVVAVGTTGESATLDEAEHCDVIKSVIDYARGRIPVIAGTGANSTTEAIALTRKARELGADACLIVTPYYNKPTQSGILTHFRLIADATDLPVILYDIPGRTGVPINYETITRIAKHPNVVGIKDAKGDFSQVSRVLNETDLLYFSGDDANVLPHLSIGATGLVGVTANIATRPYRQIVDAVNAGRLAEATAAHRLLEPLVRAVMTHVPGTVAAKYILHGLGRIDSPRVRLPLVGPEDFEAAQIEEDLARIDQIPGLDLTNFRPDRNAAAGGALPKVAGTTR